MLGAAVATTVVGAAVVPGWLVLPPLEPSLVGLGAEVWRGSLVEGAGAGLVGCAEGSDVTPGFDLVAVACTEFPGDCTG